jgi:hypothetical protein
MFCHRATEGNKARKKSYNEIIKSYESLLLLSILIIDYAYHLWMMEGKPVTPVLEF